MPELPSGLKLGLLDDALFDPGTNWFACPENHFWYWAPDEDMGPPPFPRGTEIVQSPRHAAVPDGIDGVKAFIRVVFFDEDGGGYWTGEWLSTFPAHISLAEADRVAWETWLNDKAQTSYFEKTLARCQAYARRIAGARGYAVIKGTGGAAPDGMIAGVHVSGAAGILEEDGE
jgi:hypothetical protein